MSGIWLVSYVILWVIVLGLVTLVIGCLREIGVLHLQLDPHLAAPSAPKVIGEPSPQDDGPQIGSLLPNIAWETVNQYPTVKIVTPPIAEEMLVLCMSPMCDTCQHIVDSLNALAKDASRRLRIVVVLRADESACRAFLSVFPLQVPVVCDANRTITMSLGVHRNPFGLFYDTQGVLIRKGIILGEDELRIIVGEEPTQESARLNVFPHASEPELAPSASGCSPEANRSGVLANEQR